MKQNNNIINESVSEDKYIPPKGKEFDDLETLWKVIPSNLVSSYARAFDRRLADGYTRNSNIYYGNGVYLNLNLDAALMTLHGGGYGDCILKVKLLGGFQDFLFFDRHLSIIANLCKKIYGLNANGKIPTVQEQLKMITGDDGIANTYATENARTFGRDYQKRIWNEGYMIRGIVYDWGGGHPVALPFNFGDVIACEAAENLSTWNETKSSVVSKLRNILDDKSRETQAKWIDTIPQMNMMNAKKDNVVPIRCAFDGCLYAPYESRNGYKNYNLVKIDEKNVVKPKPEFVFPKGIKFDDIPGLPDHDGIFYFSVEGIPFMGLINHPAINAPAFLFEPEDDYYPFDRINDAVEVMKRYKNVVEEGETSKNSLLEGFSPEMSAAEFISDGNNRNVFVCAHNYSVEGIFRKGFSRQFANANDFAQNRGALTYGDGQYGTPELSNAVNNLSKKTGNKPDGLKYGGVILKCVLIDGFNRFLILDEPMAKRTYGDKWQIFDQIDLLVKNPKDNQELKSFAAPYVNLSYRPDYNGRTNHIVFHMFDGGMPSYQRMNSFNKWTEFFRRNNIRGAVYHGQGDGFCFVCYNFSEVVPIAASYDDGRTWTSEMFDWNRTRDRLSIDADVAQKVGHKFKDVSKFVQKVTCNGKVFGITLVKTKDGKANCVFPDGTQISPFNFDYAPTISDDGEIEFEYKGIPFTGVISHETAGIPAFYFEPDDDYYPFDQLDNAANFLQQQK